MPQPSSRDQNPRSARLCRLSARSALVPGGARVAVSIVVNFEEGVSFRSPYGDPENEAVYESSSASRPT
jgi:hypothetical protein